MCVLKQMHEACGQEETKDLVAVVVEAWDQEEVVMFNSQIRISRSKRKIKKKMRNKSTKQRKQDRC